MMKKLVIPALAVTVSVLSAFATKPTTQMFRFNGSSLSWQDRVNPAKYSTHTPVGCSGTPNVQCSLLAAPNGSTGQPIIGTVGALYDALRNSDLSQPDFDEPAIGGKP